MKKIISALILAILVAGLATTAVLAGGDKVHGDKGEGDTAQECLRFDGCPYGSENPPPPTP